MLIIMLAVAMTVAMLVATALALHQESQQAKLPVRVDRDDPFDQLRR
jgi:hypothetical protein